MDSFPETWRKNIFKKMLLQTPAKFALSLRELSLTRLAFNYLFNSCLLG